VFSTASALEVRDVDVEGSPGDGVVVLGGHVTLQRYRYQQSQGRALVIEGGGVDASQVTVDATADGIVMSQGSLQLHDSNLAAPLQIGSDEIDPPPPGTRDVTITGTTFASSINATLAHVTISDSTITIPPVPFARPAIALVGGDLTITHSTIQGCAGTGIDAMAQFDLGQLPGDEALLVPSLSLDAVEITQCQRGLSFSGARSGTQATAQLRVRNSHVQSVDRALTVDGLLATADLGTLASPGNNRLETTAGAVAIDDELDAGVVMDAHGTTLNGVSFDGQDVIGPADVAGGYHLAVPTEIRF
jgi:hypothetical protein